MVPQLLHSTQRSREDTINTKGQVKSVYINMIGKEAPHSTVTKEKYSINKPVFKHFLHAKSQCRDQWQNSPVPRIWAPGLRMHGHYDAFYGGILLQTQNQKKNLYNITKHAHTISKNTKPKEKLVQHYERSAHHFKKQKHFQTARTTFQMAGTASRKMVLCFLKWCACASTDAMHTISKAPSDPSTNGIT